jgi:hypothetical protein
VELLFDTGSIRFDGVAWTTTRPAIAIFDGVFVAENVHSDDVIDMEQRRNLYRVIVGDQRVKLAEEDAALAQESRAKTVEITTERNGPSTGLYTEAVFGCHRSAVAPVATI